MFWQQILYLALYEFGKSGEWPSQLKIGMEKINLNLTFEQKEMFEHSKKAIIKGIISQFKKGQEAKPKK